MGVPQSHHVHKQVGGDAVEDFPLRSQPPPCQGLDDVLHCEEVALASGFCRAAYALQAWQYMKTKLDVPLLIQQFCGLCFSGSFLPLKLRTENSQLAPRDKINAAVLKYNGGVKKEILYLLWF